MCSKVTCSVDALCVLSWLFLLACIMGTSFHINKYKSIKSFLMAPQYFTIRMMTIVTAIFLWALLPARPCCKGWTSINLCHLPKPQRASVCIVPILQMGRLRHGKVRQPFSASHRQYPMPSGVEPRPLDSRSILIFVVDTFRGGGDIKYSRKQMKRGYFRYWKGLWKKPVLLKWWGGACNLDCEWLRKATMRR